MAFELQREKIYPLADTYRGPTANIEMEFPFVFPPFIDPMTSLQTLVDIALFANEIVPLIKNNYLSYQLSVDDKGGFNPDHYRVKVIVAGETQAASGTVGPFLSKLPIPSKMRKAGVRHLRKAQADPKAFITISLLVGIALALGILLVFAAVAYKIFNGDWGPVAAGGILLVIIAGVGAVGLIGYGLFGPKRRPAPAPTPVRMLREA